ncbi:histone-lysine N-methyltransferase, H3 lysine-79 specific-like [Onychostoma macrolepis]|nr:histone-lysine N-methyltransferase, H3 lysine-79 specific-like [Onychostoma macrolepis]
MDEALGRRPCISPSVIIDSAAQDVLVIAPPNEEPSTSLQKRKKRDTDLVAVFKSMQERDEERERMNMERREREALEREDRKEMERLRREEDREERREREWRAWEERRETEHRERERKGDSAEMAASGADTASVRRLLRLSPGICWIIMLDGISVDMEGILFYIDLIRLHDVPICEAKIV